jgi:hypothetical protein
MLAPRTPVETASRPRFQFSPIVWLGNSATPPVSAAELENIRLSQQALLAVDYFSLAAADMARADP